MFLVGMPTIWPGFLAGDSECPTHICTAHQQKARAVLVQHALQQLWVMRNPAESCSRLSLTLHVVM